MSAFSKWFDIIRLVTPIVAAFVPGAAPLAPYILAGIQEAEQLKNATGEAKKAHALAVVGNGIKVTNTLRPGTIEPTTGAAAASAAIETVLLVTKTIHGAHEEPKP